MNFQEKLLNSSTELSGLIGTIMAIMQDISSPFAREQLYRATSKAIANHCLSEQQKAEWQVELTEKYIDSMKRHQTIINKSQLVTA